jgi:hypothetical protein
MRTTKLELTQLLAARNAEIEALRLQVADLQGQLLAAKGKAPSVKRSTYVPRPVDPEVLRRRELMAVAKAAAMANGRSVAVSF